MSHPKATAVSQLRQFFNPLPLPPSRLEGYYVPTANVRGGRNVAKRLENILRNPRGTESFFEEQAEWEKKSTLSHYQIIFSGYKGCGKSTELNRLQKSIQDDFLVLKYSVMQKLDPMSLHYVELFIVTMEELFLLIEEHDLYGKISEEFIENIQFWAGSKEVTEIRDKHFSVEGEMGGDVTGALKWFTGFFAKFRLAAKSSRSMKETIRQNIEPKLSDLILLCNALITEIENALPDFGKKGMVIFIEDLDKIPLDRATNLFKNYANQVTALNTNVIFTFPLALVYNPNFKSIRASFDESIILPMVKVNDKDGHPFPEGRQALKEMVRRRMDLSLFETENLLDQMIAYSGGCIRDLFLMILEAGENAQDWDRDTITEADYQRAYQALKSEYENILSDKLIPNESGIGSKVDVSVEEYLEALVSLAKEGSSKVVYNTKPILDLRQNLAILSYNGTEWCDVHPIMKDILRDRGKI